MGFGLISPKEKFSHLRNIANMVFKACLSILVVFFALHTSRSMNVKPKEEENCCKVPEMEKDMPKTIDMLVAMHDPTETECGFKIDNPEVGVNYPGGDFGGKSTRTATLPACACLCQKLCGCKMFHFNSDTRECWLKHTITKREDNRPGNEISVKMKNRMY